jgi:NADPH:quinone reductase-like Zn-dependent oxidoreductase
MRAAILHAFDQPPRVGEFAEPEPGPGEVLVEVHAAGLHPVVRALASGTHYGSSAQLPCIPGIDGAGTLPDGTRVYFGMPRPPHGSFAARTVVPRQMCLPLPPALDSPVAAALFNPGLSAWLALVVRGRLAAGECVLVLGATGVAGKLAVQAARALGAGRVIAVGRNVETLRTLPAMGADVTIPLDRAPEVLPPLAGSVDLVIDYLWGAPIESLLRAFARKGLRHQARPLRLVSVGESAGATASIPADLLRSSGVEISGSGAGTVPMERIATEVPRFVEQAVAGALRVEVQPVALTDVEAAWQRPPGGGRRLVVVPD